MAVYHALSMMYIRYHGKLINTLWLSELRFRIKYVNLEIIPLKVNRPKDAYFPMGEAFERGGGVVT